MANCRYEHAATEGGDCAHAAIGERLGKAATMKRGKELLRFSVAAVLVAFLLCAVADSQTNGSPGWPGDVALDTSTGDQGVGTATGPGIAMVQDGSGGAIVIWEDDASGNVKAQRISSAGVKLWAAPVAVAPISAWQMSPRAVPD